MTTITGSSAFKSATYNSSTKELTVQYSSGSYTYSGVTQAEADGIQSATSKGRELQSVIAGKSFSKN